MSKTYYAPAKNILTVNTYFKAHPESSIYLKFITEYWNKARFKAWFIHCLDLKTGGSELTEADILLRRDAHIINEYARGIRRPGRNLLSTPKLKKRYPHIDNQISDY